MRCASAYVRMIAEKNVAAEGDTQLSAGSTSPMWPCFYRDADKSLARPARKQAAPVKSVMVRLIWLG